MLTLKQRFAGRLLKFAGVKRVHIIGCSRSGTTMLHLSMTCFDATIFSSGERPVEYPYLWERVKIAASRAGAPARRFLITKRNFSWWQDHRIEAAIRQADIDDLGILHLVRDPRDVMLSIYKGGKKTDPYVSPDHWYNSVTAAERIMGALNGRVPMCTVRYEDIILHPRETEERLETSFGLSRSKDSYSIDRLADNIELKKAEFSPVMLENTGGVRNMDERSIGKFREQGRAEIGKYADDPTIRAKLEEFCEQHEYR